MDEIRENDYNLNIPRYVDTFEEEEPVNAQQLLEDMKKINSDELSLTNDLNNMMGQLVATDAESQEYLNLLKEVLK